MSPCRLKFVTSTLIGFRPLRRLTPRTLALWARVLQAVQTLAWQHEGQRLAVVTHGGVLDMIWRTALRRPLAGPREADIPNAGLNRVRVHAAGIDILEWADTRHLADLPPQPVYDQQRLVRERDAPAGLA